MSELVLRNDASGTEYALGPEVRIGSGRHCEVRLDDPACRREHAAIAHFSSGYAITPLHDKAAVSVNGEPVSGSRQLELGDVIEIGATALVMAAGARADRPHADRAPVAVARSPEDLMPRRIAADASVAFPSQHPRGRHRPRSAATRSWATLCCFAIVLADAIAVGWYLTGN